MQDLLPIGYDLHAGFSWIHVLSCVASKRPHPIGPDLEFHGVYNFAVFPFSQVTARIKYSNAIILYFT